MGTVDSVHPRWLELEELRQLPRDLHLSTDEWNLIAGGSGRITVDSAGNIIETSSAASKPNPRDYLPREPEEKNDEYEFRKWRSTLYPFYSQSVHFFTGRLYSKPVELIGATDTLLAFEEDVDGQGRNLTRFLYDMTPATFDDGLGFIFVDRTPGTGGSREDDRAAGVRTMPHWVALTASDVRNWSVSRQGGREVLDWVVLDQPRVVHEDFWVPETVKGRTVLYRAGVTPFGADNPADAVTVQRWEKLGGDWEMVEPTGPGRLSELQEIPLVPIYYGRHRRMFEAQPTLRGIADLNLAHYRKRSDVDHYLHVTSVPTLHRSGITEKEAEDTVIGVYRLLWASEPRAKAEWVEIEGSGLRLALDDVKDIEARIASMGLQVLGTNEQGLVTATGRLIDEGNATTRLEAWQLSTADSVELALNFTSQLMGEDPGGVAVQMNADLSAAGLGDEARQRFLLEMRKLGDLSREGLLEQAKAVGGLTDTFDLETETDRILAESGAPGATGQFRAAVRRVMELVESGESLDAALDRVESEVAQ